MKTTAVLQKSAEKYEPTGHLDPTGFQRHISFNTYVPGSKLKAFIDHFWVISWDKSNEQPYISEQVMQRPYVDIFISTTESGIQCTFRGKKAYKASGAGRIIGARFKPGAFHAFWQGPFAKLYDKTIALQQVFPEADKHFIAYLLSLDDQTAVKALEQFILNKKPEGDPNIELINDIITAIENDKELTTVTAIAKKFHRSERWLQQFFSTYVGLGIKWLLQRQKLLSAAKYIREHEQVNWADLAYDLGYSSQQHFITDFKRVLGKTPVAYKKELTS